MRTSPALIFISVLYLAVAAVSTWIAVTRNLPQAMFGWTTGNPASEDYLLIGTALSMPVAVLAVHALLTVLAANPKSGGTVGVIGLGLLGILSIAAGLGQPIVGRAFSLNSSDPTIALLLAASFLLAAGLTIMSIIELTRRFGSDREESNPYLR